MANVNLYKEYLIASIEYGEGYCKMYDPYKKEEISEYFDFTEKFEVKSENEKIDYSQIIKVLDYKLYQILYTLNDNQGIQTLEMIYKNRNDLKEETLLKTKNAPLKKDIQKIELNDNEEIIEVLFYVNKENRLVALSMKTSLDHYHQIGSVDKGDCKNDPKINNNRNIIFGFGGYSGDKYGVSSLYCYYMDKNKYGIVLNNGLLQLRTKLKKDNKFKEELMERRSKLSEKHQLILDVCGLPDTAFFPIASYIMSN